MKARLVVEAGFCPACAAPADMVWNRVQFPDTGFIPIQELLRVQCTNFACFGANG